MTLDRHRLVLTGLGVAASLAATPVLVGAVAGPGGPGAASVRIHRLVLPPADPVPGAPPGEPPPVPPPPPLERALAVDELEFKLVPSQTTVAAGAVDFNVYNRGMDDHDLAIYNAAGKLQMKVDVASGGMKSISPTLMPGDYRVVCSLFAGTAASHEQLGMRFYLRVQ